jgi:hypothetical protein
MADTDDAAERVIAAFTTMDTAIRDAMSAFAAELAAAFGKVFVAPQERPDEDRIRDAMAEATDHPGRVVTR